MDELSGIFLDMNAGNADTLAAVQFDIALFTEGLIILRNLVGFRQIGIYIILSVHMGLGIDFAVQRQAGFNGIFHHFLVENGKGSRLTRANRAAMGVGLSPEFGGAAAKILVLVASSIWVSIPQTIHNSYPGTSFVYANHFSGALFIKMSRLKNRCLIKFSYR